MEMGRRRGPQFDLNHRRPAWPSDRGGLADYFTCYRHCSLQFFITSGSILFLSFSKDKIGTKRNPLKGDCFSFIKYVTVGPLHHLSINPRQPSDSEHGLRVAQQTNNISRTIVKACEIQDSASKILTIFSEFFIIFPLRIFVTLVYIYSILGAMRVYTVSKRV